MTHAGFWVDGAVREPKADGADISNMVAVLWKDRNEIDLVNVHLFSFENVYWLDTTPRESLTPKELFSVLKVLWPRCEAAFAPDFASVVQWQITNEATDFQTPITWGDVTQYPPLVEPQWVRITRENVGQYLFRECRCKDVEFESWEAGRVVGWDLEDECCLVDGSTVERVMKYDFVEVQNAATP